MLECMHACTPRVLHQLVQQGVHSHMLSCVMISDASSSRCDEGIRRATASGSPSRSIDLSRPYPSCSGITEEAQCHSAGEPRGPAVCSLSCAIARFWSVCFEKGPPPHPPPPGPAGHLAAGMDISAPLFSCHTCRATRRPTECAGPRALDAGRHALPQQPGPARTVPTSTLRL